MKIHPLGALQRQGGGSVARRGPVLTAVREVQGDPWSEVVVRDTGEVWQLHAQRCTSAPVHVHIHTGVGTWTWRHITKTIRR